MKNAIRQRIKKENLRLLFKDVHSTKIQILLKNMKQLKIFQSKCANENE